LYNHNFYLKKSFDNDEDDYNSYIKDIEDHITFLDKHFIKKLISQLQDYMENIGI